MLPSFLQFMLSLKSFELIRSRARPRPRLSWWWSSSLVSGHVSVLGIELSDGGGGGGDLELSGDTPCQASGSRGVVGDPIVSTSGLGEGEGLACGYSRSEFLSFKNIDLCDF